MLVSTNVFIVADDRDRKKSSHLLLEGEYKNFAWLILSIKWSIYYLC